MGKEEEEIIKPFINSSNDNLTDLFQLTFFTKKNIDKYDVFLTMFHDQQSSTFYLEIPKYC